MFIYLFLLFTVLPVLELMVLIRVGGQIGVFNTVILVVGIGLLGSYLARLQGFMVLTKIQDNLSRGVMPNEELLDGAMILVGGILLLTPGFITDILGIFFLMPWSRSLIKILVKSQLKTMAEKGQIVHWNMENKQEKKYYDDIDLN